MFRIINEANFLKCIFQKSSKENSCEYQVQGMKSGLSGKGIVLDLKSENGFELHKSLKEMIIDGTWKVRYRNEGHDKYNKLINFLEGRYKEIEDFLKKQLKKEDLNKNPLIDVNIYRNKDFNYQTDWLKIQALRDFPENTTLEVAKKRLKKRLDEDKNTWIFLSKNNQPKPLKAKVVEKYINRNEFLNYLYDARQHSQDRVSDKTLTKFAPYLAHAFDMYWSVHIPKLVKKCDHVSISSNIVQEGNGAEQWLLCPGKDNRIAELILYFKAPGYSRQAEIGYKAVIRITAQNIQSDKNLADQLLGTKDNFKNRLNEVCTALSEYFNINGMIVQHFGDLNFRNKRELEDWLNSIENPMTEKDIQALGKWVSRGGMNCFGKNDIILAKELLAKNIFTTRPTVEPDKSATSNEQAKIEVQAPPYSILDKIKTKFISILISIKQRVLKIFKTIIIIIIGTTIAIGLFFAFAYFMSLKKVTVYHSTENGVKTTEGKNAVQEINNEEIIETEIIDDNFIENDEIPPQIDNTPFFTVLISGEPTGEKSLVIKKHEDYEAYYKKIMQKITMDYLFKTFNFKTEDFVTIEFKILYTGEIKNVSKIKSSKNDKLDNEIKDFMTNIKLENFPEFINEKYIIARFKFVFD